MESSPDFDLFVIGGGSGKNNILFNSFKICKGGIAAARRAASFGAKVALAEKHVIGGIKISF